MAQAPLALYLHYVRRPGTCACASTYQYLEEQGLLYIIPNPFAPRAAPLCIPFCPTPPCFPWRANVPPDLLLSRWTSSSWTSALAV